MNQPNHNIPGINANFLKAISGWMVMTAEDIMDRIGTLDKPDPHVVPQAYTLQQALDSGFIPALAPDAAGIFTKSEQLLQDYARKRTMNATDLKTLIQDVLQHPEFNSKDVEPDMHARLMKAVADGDVEIHDMWKPGDGSQTLQFFKRNVENVLRELLADIRLAGNQHFEYKEYRNAAGERIFACDANGSVTFQIAQTRAGEGVVPVSLPFDSAAMTDAMRKPWRMHSCSFCRA